MKQHPILFSAPMVRALLDGSKTQTRRVIKSMGELDTAFMDCGGYWHQCASDGSHQSQVTGTVVGDQLWVRESWTTRQALDNTKPSEISQKQSIGYIADDEGPCLGKKRPSIFMCRWMSRITLNVTDVRVQRLQDISERDAIEEGIDLMNNPPDNEGNVKTPCGIFRTLWDSINAKHAPWENNPWVVAYTFEVMQ